MLLEFLVQYCFAALLLGWKRFYVIFWCIVPEGTRTTEGLASVAVIAGCEPRNFIRTSFLCYSRGFVEKFA